jgi:D-glycero-D-manno-heptose 1,7-bisphosphate phosphatase
MLLEAARTHKIDLRRSWMVGDNQSDIEAGKQAGCRTAFMTQKLSSRSTDADIVADNWDSLAAAILRFRQ